MIKRLWCWIVGHKAPWSMWKLGEILTMTQDTQYGCEKVTVKVIKINKPCCRCGRIL